MSEIVLWDVYTARTRGPWRRINFEKSEFPRIQTRKQL